MTPRSKASPESSSPFLSLLVSDLDTTGGRVVHATAGDISSVNACSKVMARDAASLQP